MSVSVALTAVATASVATINPAIAAIAAPLQPARFAAQALTDATPAAALPILRSICKLRPAR
ncbi:hypothetical protein EDC01DRAFT_783250 [Geopyxis carbonaria]|nr:hypothetical protein EDC01DRAFT_783250 [Geopyxis carbonaria]